MEPITALLIALFFTGADGAVNTAINGDTGHTISGQSHIDCLNQNETACMASDTYDLIAPLYVVDTVQYAMFGDFDLIGKPHTEGRALHEARNFAPEANYGFAEYKHFIEKRR
jgi:hypothetical protein